MATKKPPARTLTSFADLDEAGIGIGYGYQPQEEAEPEKPQPEQGLMSGIGSSLWQGVKSTARSVMSTGNTVAGDLSDVELLSKAQEADAVNDPAAKQALMQEIQKRKAANPGASAWDAVKDVAGAAWDNKTGTAQLVAEQAPNSAVALGAGFAGSQVGRWAGAKAGAALGTAIAPGVGTLIGGGLGFLSGMFLGNALLETGGKAMEKARDGFTEQERNDALREGAVKAGVITGVDAVTLGLGRYGARALNGAAIQAGARAEAKVLADAGVDITRGPDIMAALAKSPDLRLAATKAGEAASKAASKLPTRAGTATGLMATETIGEGVGEYYGEEAATGKGDVYDAALESLASFSQSAPEAFWSMTQSSGNNLNVQGMLDASPLTEQAAKPGSVLSRAALAGNPELHASALAAAADLAPQVDALGLTQPGDDQEAQRAAYGDLAQTLQQDPQGPVSRLSDKPTGAPPVAITAGQQWQDIKPIGNPALETSELPTPITPPQESTDGTQAPQAQQAEPQEPQAPAAPVARTQVNAPKALAGSSNIPQKKAQLAQLADDGFETVERRADGFWLVNTLRDIEMRLAGGGDAQLARVAIAAYVQAQADTAAASPNNELKNPTQAQIAAGNYKKSDVIHINGMRVVLENPAGSVRSGVSPEGKAWRTDMVHHYGEFRGTEGADGDPVDVIVGPRPDSNKVFVVDQVNPDGSFDEHKALLGFTDIEAARQGYLANYEKGWTGLGAITEMTAAQFKAWAKSDLAKQPAARYAEGQTTGAQDDGRGTERAAADAGIAGGPDRQSGGVAESPVPAGSLHDPAAAQPGSTGASEAHARNNQAVVAALPPVVGGTRVADPSLSDTRALDWLLDIFASLTGKRGIAVQDELGGDGFAYGGNFFVNIKNPHMHVAWSIGHEFKHLSEHFPGIKKLYDRLWSMIGEPGKRAYFEYLQRTGQIAESSTYDSAVTKAASGDEQSQREMALLKEEMIADFMGKRFNDREWLEQLRDQKPKLFGDFVRDWIVALGQIIGALKGEKWRMDGVKNVDLYISQLEEAKQIAMEVAAVWAEKNPKLAAASRGTVQYAKRAGPIERNPIDQFLVPEIEGRFNADTGNIAILPALRVTRDGRELSFAPMPVRIQVGQHNIKGAGSTVPQFGAQHRLDHAEDSPGVRGYLSPKIGSAGHQKVERAVRDIAAAVLNASQVFADKKSNFAVVLWSPQTRQSVVLEKDFDSRRNPFWSVKTVIPKNQWVMENSYGVSAPIKGITLDGIDTQQSNAVIHGMLIKLRAPTVFLGGGESYSVSGDGIIVNPDDASAPQLLVDQPSPPPARAQLQRGVDGKIILNKNKLNYSARIDAINDLGNFNLDVNDLDMAEFLEAQKLLDQQAELDLELQEAIADPEEMRSEPPLSAAGSRKLGLMAEAAYPGPVWQERDGGLTLEAHVPDLYSPGKSGRLQLEEQNDGTWGAGLRGTWVGPSQFEKDGYTSRAAAEAFVQRYAASHFLARRGFDLAATSSPAQQKKLLAAWRALNQLDLPVRSVRRYGRTQVDSRALKEIARDLGLTLAYEVKIETAPIDQTSSMLSVFFTHKKTGTTESAQLQIENTKAGKIGTAHTEGLQKNGLGAAFYQLMAEYAASHDITIAPDFALSGINSYRRTEQMLSAALRTGQSNVMTPHSVQRVYGFEDDAKTDKQHDANLVRLLLAGLRNARELAPVIDTLSYHPETGVFTDADGADADDQITRILADPDVRAFGLGRSTLARAALTRMALDGKLDARAVTSFHEPVLYSAREDAAIEYEAVRSQYANSEQWLKAPNGKDTLLTERQWIQVRTPSFKAWFGNWEAFASQPGGVWNDDQGVVSKVVDENGEPLVVYHGTDKGGFTEFQQPGGAKRGDLGIFTTSNREMAASYVKRGQAKSIDLPIPSSKAELQALGVFFDTEMIDDTNRFFWYDGFSHGPFETEAGAVANARRNFKPDYETRPGIYAAFINLRNPQEDDFEGANWNGSRDHQWQVLIGDEPYSDPSTGQMYFEEDEAREIAREFAAPEDDDSGADLLKAADDTDQSTDDVVLEARRSKNDGAIVRAVMDDGGGNSPYAGEPSDVFVAFQPGQLKSADWNSGEFGDGDDLRYSTRDIGVNPRVLEAVPGIQALARHLTPQERAKLRTDTAQKLLDIHLALPAADEVAAVAYAGKAKRGWYRHSKEGIDHIFDADGWRFTGLLAALSPQVSVEINLENTLNTWKNWVAAGRPQTRAEIVAVMGRSVQGIKGEDSVLNAWINNAARALTAPQQDGLVLSGPKVNSFYQNLIGNLDEVTNDAWMANYALIDQLLFSGSANKAGTEPGKGAGYMAMNAKVRSAAKKLGWQPAEVQETVWSFSMSLLEMMDARAESRGAIDLMNDGALSDEVIGKTKDFRILFHEPRYAAVLEAAGYTSQLESLDAPVAHEDNGPAPFNDAKMGKLLTGAGLRLEFLQRQRRTNVQMSWESRPGESTGVLPGMHDAPLVLQQQHQADIFAAIAASGFYEKTGLSLRNTLFGPSAWQGKVLAGVQTLTRPGIVADNKGGLTVDPESRRKIGLAASVLGLVLNQEGVYWHYPIYRSTKQAANGAEMDFGRSLTTDEMARLYRIIIKKAGHDMWAPANTPTGVRLLNFSDIANIEFYRTAKSALTEFSKKFSGDATIKQFGSDGDAIENNWKEAPDGQGYRSRIGEAGRSDLFEWIDGPLQAAVDGVNRRYSEQYGWGAATRAEAGAALEPGAEGGARVPDGGADAAAARGSVRQPDVVSFSGRDFTGFFSNITGGLTGRPGGKAYTPVLSTEPIADFVREYSRHRGRFDDHIGASIPGFRELQTIVGAAITKSYSSANMLDIGASEGALIKTISQQSKGAIKTVALDPNFAMARHFNEGEPVVGANYDTSAFGDKSQEGQEAWTEDETLTDRDGSQRPNPFAGQVVRYYRPDRQFDVVHEAMVFQFISGDRASQIARAKELMKKDGVLILEQKLVAGPGLAPAQFRANEQQKDAFKEQYFSKAEIAAKAKAVGVAEKKEFEAGQQKKEQVVTGMNDLMVAPGALEAVLHDNFSHVVQFWDSGNFKGYLASDSQQAVQKLLDNMLPTHSEFATVATPRIVGAPQYSARDPLGFYSELSKQIDGSGMKQAPAGAWKSFIKALSQKGVKADEIEWTGVNDWLDLQIGPQTHEVDVAMISSKDKEPKGFAIYPKGAGDDAEAGAVFYTRAEAEIALGNGKVTKEALLGYLAANGVRVQEVVLTNDGHAYQVRANPSQGGWEVRTPDGNWWGGYATESQAKAAGHNDTPENPPKYSQYTLPGGTNYREVLLTLPEAKLTIGQYAALKGISESEAIADRTGFKQEQGRRARTDYKSSHWDQANVLTHIRMNDRVDAEGGKVLFIDELQSDWGQAAKKKGIKGAPLYIKGMEGQIDGFMGLNASGVPDAPFIGKTDAWLSLALKRIITMAVEGGYDKIAFVNGEQSADRYDLSKQVSAIDYRVTGDQNYHIAVYDITGTPLSGHIPKSLDANALEQYVGKELAQKIVAQATGTEQTFKGLDLKVGGEGMKAFYDTIVPNTVNAVLKKLGGGKAGVVRLAQGESGENGVYRDAGNPNAWHIDGSDETYRTEALATAELLRQRGGGQPGFEITDTLRAKAEQGLPLFSKRDRAAFDDEQAHQDAAKTPKKPRKYAGKKVSVPVKIEDTGEVATLIMDVNRTLDDIDKRTENMERLLACL